MTATEIAVECANIQSEMWGVRNRMKYLQRLVGRGEQGQLLGEGERNEKEVEDLDSSFQSNIRI